MLRTTQLLAHLSNAYRHEKEFFSKEAIGKKINEIKYLSAQKKVPKLTLRREILHLEEQLKSITEFEKSLLKQKRQESAKIAILKKQNEVLQKRLAAVQDKDLHKKVEKLSHLLADAMAKSSTQNVEISQVPIKTPALTLPERLEYLKEEIAKQPNHPKAALLQQKIEQLERQLQPPIPIKHDILFKAQPRPEDND